MEENNRRTLLREIDDTDAMSSSRIPAVKVSYEIQGMYTIPWFPRVVLDPKTFPLDEEMESSIDHPAAKISSTVYSFSPSIISRGGGG